MPFPLTFFLGTVISFLASIPVGAVNMAVVQTTLNRGRKAAFMIGVGAIIVETVYCALPLFGLTFFLEKDSPIFHGVFLASIPLLIFLGVYTIVMRKKAAIKDSKEAKPTGAGSFILYGATLCGTNPMVLFFWAGITSTLQHKELLTHELPTLITFLAGVPLGTFLLYYLFIAVAQRQHKQISLRARIRMNLAVGIIFLVLGVYLAVNYLMKVL